MQALVPDAGADCVACLRLQLTVRAAARPEDEPADKEAFARPDLRFSSCRVKALRFHLLGQETDAVALYEQFFAHCRGVYFRALDSFGDPVVIPGEPGMIRQIGFDENEALIPNDNQLFRGFDFLRDYFAFPRRFLGFDMIGLGSVAGRLEAKTVDIMVAFDDVKAQLACRDSQGLFRPLRGARREPVRERRWTAFPSEPISTSFPSFPTGPGCSISRRTG